jgi:N-acetylglucosaminyl-diphospho-decaprenol L-rhamnosyltransferase
MLVRREPFEAVGGFDEGYWMYWEDADLSRRLRNDGWRTGFCVEAQARHLTGSSGRSARTIRAFHDSAARYYTRHLARGVTSARLGRAVLALRARWMLRREGRRGDAGRA